MTRTTTAIDAIAAADTSAAVAAYRRGFVTGWRAAGAPSTRNGIEYSGWRTAYLMAPSADAPLPSDTAIMFAAAAAVLEAVGPKC